MKWSLIALMVSILTIIVACAGQVRQIPTPCPKCPVAEPVPQHTVEVQQCYFTIGQIVLFPGDEETPIIPVPTLEPGCRCLMILDDDQVWTIHPVDPIHCEPEEDEEEAEPEAETLLNDK